MHYSETEMFLTPATKKLTKYIEPPLPSPHAVYRGYEGVGKNRIYERPTCSVFKKA